MSSHLFFGSYVIFRKENSSFIQQLSNGLHPLPIPSLSPITYNPSCGVDTSFLTPIQPPIYPLHHHLFYQITKQFVF